MTGDLDNVCEELRRGCVESALRDGKRIMAIVDQAIPCRQQAVPKGGASFGGKMAVFEEDKPRLPLFERETEQN